MSSPLQLPRMCLSVARSLHFSISRSLSLGRCDMTGETRRRVRKVSVKKSGKVTKSTEVTGKVTKSGKVTNCPR